MALASTSDWVRFAEEEYNQMAMEHAAEEETGADDSIVELETAGDDAMDTLSPQKGGRAISTAAEDTPALRRGVVARLDVR